jgi:hypothetical protein
LKCKVKLLVKGLAFCHNADKRSDKKMNFNEKLKALRKQAGLSQEQLAEKEMFFGRKHIGNVIGHAEQ